VRFSPRLIIALPLFVFSLVLLRQGILLMSERIPALQQQTRVIQQRDIEPAALFYTDSAVALQAIRNTDSRIRSR